MHEVVIVLLAVILLAALLVVIFSTTSIAGTLVINLSREDKDIAQFVLETPLEDIAKKRFIVLKIRQSNTIKSLDEVKF